MIINKNLIRDYFIFSKRERRGVIALSSIILLIWGSYFFIDQFTGEEPWETYRFQDEIALLKKIQKEQKGKTFEKKNNPKKEFSGTLESKEKLPAFPVNPNKLKFKEWMSLGLSFEETKALFEFKNKIGGFSNAGDLQSIIPETKKKTILPVLKLIERKNKLSEETKNNQEFSPSIEPKNFSDPKTTKEGPKKSKEIFELNSCGLRALKQFDCIDSVTAQRILQRRKALGGFVSIDQLTEIDSLHESCIHALKSFAITDTGMIRKIDINHVSVKTLGRHPYIGYNVAMALVNFRDKHGKFKGPGDMKKCMIMTEERMAKIKPYLIYSD